MKLLDNVMACTDVPAFMLAVWRCLLVCPQVGSCVVLLLRMCVLFVAAAVPFLFRAYTMPQAQVDCHMHNCQLTRIVQTHSHVVCHIALCLPIMRVHAFGIRQYSLVLMLYPDLFFSVCM